MKKKFYKTVLITYQEELIWKFCTVMQKSYSCIWRKRASNQIRLAFKCIIFLYRYLLALALTKGIRLRNFELCIIKSFSNNRSYGILAKVFFLHVYNRIIGLS